MFAIPAILLAQPLRSLTEGIKRPLPVTLTNFLMLLMAIIGNYLFIFGNYGFPEMGARGSGLSAIIGTWTALFVLLIYIISTWLINFNIINTSNRFVYTVMEAMYRLCEPSLNFVRKYIPNFGTIDISPIIVYLALWFIKSLLIEYWPR